MLKIKFYLILLLLIFSINCQRNLLPESLPNLEGIWIAEDYLKSFEQTKSSLKSKDAFDLNYPVGLRINLTEMEHGILNIGYGVLHDHSLYPEVSKYVVVEKDTVREGGNFFINTLKSDTLNYYKTTEISYFNYKCNSYFSWEFSSDTTIILFRPKNQESQAETIRYKRISNTFSKDYLFPNPIYYYTRSKTLIGNYELQDGLGNILSTNFTIGLNGRTSGYEGFLNKSIYFSTEVYCGPHADGDIVILCDIDPKYDFDCSGFIYNRTDENTIQFHEIISYGQDNMDQTSGKMMYKLIKW
jgi:hypothetical protein